MFFMKFLKFFFLFSILFSLAFLAFQNHANRKTIYFYTGFFGLEDKDQDICFYGQNLSDICREKGYTLKITRSLDQKSLKNLYKLVIFDLEGVSRKKLRSYPQKRLVLFLWEPPSTVPKNYQSKYHRYFSKIYTWNDALVDNRKYFKFYYPERRKMIANENQKVFAEKKLLTMIARCKSSSHPDALYSKREEAVQFFEGKEGFTLFGPAWDKKYKNYQGSIPSKEVLKDFRFSLCYENMQNISGYVTEKIFDAFHFGSVPVYLGADNITKYVPKNCFIDRRKFRSLDELNSYLRNMKEEEYQLYLENIETFLKSKKTNFFSPEYFALMFQKALFE